MRDRGNVCPMTGFVLSYEHFNFLRFSNASRDRHNPQNSWHCSKSSNRSVARGVNGFTYLLFLLFRLWYAQLREVFASPGFANEMASCSHQRRKNREGELYGYGPVFVLPLPPPAWPTRCAAWASAYGREQCYCGAGSLPINVDICPGCQRNRCADCPTEKVQVRDK